MAVSLYCCEVASTHITASYEVGPLVIELGPYLESCRGQIDKSHQILHNADNALRQSPAFRMIVMSFLSEFVSL